MIYCRVYLAVKCMFPSAISVVIASVAIDSIVSLDTSYDTIYSRRIRRGGVVEMVTMGSWVLSGDGVVVMYLIGVVGVGVWCDRGAVPMSTDEYR